MVKFVVSF